MGRSRVGRFGGAPGPGRLAFFILFTVAAAWGRSPATAQEPRIRVSGAADSSPVPPFPVKPPPVLSNPEGVLPATAIDREESSRALKTLLQALSGEMPEREILDLYHAAELTPLDREEFLKQAMTHRLRGVRQLAFDELVRLNLLNRVVVASLLELAREPQPESVEAAVVGLERLDIGDAPEEYIVTLLQQLSPASTSESVRAAAEAQLTRLRAKALPVLVGIVLDKSADPTLRQTAASRLSKLMKRAPDLPTFSPRFPESVPMTSGGSDSGPPLPPMIGPVGGSARSAPPEESFPSAAAPAEQPTLGADQAPSESPSRQPESASAEDGTKPQRVRVYYGTNREALVPATSPAWIPLANFSGGTLIALIFVLVVGALRKWSYRTLTATGVLTLLFAFVVGWIWDPFAAYSEAVEHSRGVVFGPRADADGLVHFGHCDVTLPPIGKREVGELPMTTPGRENPEKHVILERTGLLEEEAFYGEVKARLADLKVGERDVFVFIHGYNVDFRSAACRTAQLSLDLEFQGIPLFFSWPSRAEFLGYMADVDEVQDSVTPLKQFLLRVAQDLNAEKVHILAHSRGGAAVSFALREIDPQKRLFNQVILAAPDINANTFRRDIVPKLSKLALRSTLYCSQTDRALLGSQLLNRYKRAGDASEPIVIDPLLDTIDATGLDPSLLGHSYYGDCEPLIADLRALFRQNSHPTDRGLHERKGPVKDQVYWMFKLPP